MNRSPLPPPLLANAVASAPVGFLTGWRPGGSGLWDGRGLAVLIALFAWASSSQVVPFGYRLRRQARWTYREGLAWGLRACLRAAVPFLALSLPRSGRSGMGVLEGFGLATLPSSPALLRVAPFVPLWRKKMIDRGEGRP